MDRLAFLRGDREGPAWNRRGPGRRDSLWQTETVRTKLRGQVLLVEGLGGRGCPDALRDTGGRRPPETAASHLP